MTQDCSNNTYNSVKKEVQIFSSLDIEQEGYSSFYPGCVYYNPYFGFMKESFDKGFRRAENEFYEEEKLFDCE